MLVTNKIAAIDREAQSQQQEQDDANHEEHTLAKKRRKILSKGQKGGQSGNGRQSPAEPYILEEAQVQRTAKDQLAIDAEELVLLAAGKNIVNTPNLQTNPQTAIAPPPANTLAKHGAQNLLCAPGWQTLPENLDGKAVSSPRVPYERKWLAQHGPRYTPPPKMLTKNLGSK